MYNKQKLWILVAIGVFVVASSTHITAEERPSREQGPETRERLAATPRERTIGKDGVPMVLISAGEFQMGDSFNEGLNNERPVHTVYLDAFYIDVYEITNAQYAKFLNEYGKTTEPFRNVLLDINNSMIEEVEEYEPRSGYGNRPAIAVSWYGAMAYARFYGKRLPTEAEWEKAARGGLVEKRYPWGNEIDPSKANYNADYYRGCGPGDVLVHLKRVDSYTPNSYGLYNMAGNVWEWCADWYSATYYSQSTKRNPKGPDTGSLRVTRGGGWFFNPYNLRTSYRNSGYPSSMSGHVGFRCAQDAMP